MRPMQRLSAGGRVEAPRWRVATGDGGTALRATRGDGGRGGVMARPRVRAGKWGRRVLQKKRGRRWAEWRPKRHQPQDGAGAGAGMGAGACRVCRLPERGQLHGCQLRA
jgi:hypothetical protein